MKSLQAQDVLRNIGEMLQLSLRQECRLNDLALDQAASLNRSENGWTQIVRKKYLVFGNFFTLFRGNN